MTARVTTVVVTRNRRDRLLASLTPKRGRADGPVVVVDNGSHDGTVAAVRREHPEIGVISLSSNYGALARNVGVWAAETPYVAFADDDSWWATGALDQAADELDRHPDWGLVAGRVVVGDEERPEPLSVAMGRSRLPAVDGRGARLAAGFVCRGAVVRVTALREAGGFDPIVFLAGEEERVTLDLLAAGWRVVHLPWVVAHHDPDTDPRAGRTALMLRNAFLTAVMRRRWRVVVRRGLEALVVAPVGAFGRALPRLRAAWEIRRPVPSYVEDYLALA